MQDNSTEKTVVTSETRPSAAPHTSNSTHHTDQHTTSSGFSSIADLFSESWHRMTSGALNAVLLSLVSFAVYFALFLVAFGALFGLTASTTSITELFKNLSEQGPEALAVLGPGFFAGIVIMIGILAIVSTVIGAVFTGALILAFARAGEKPSIGSLLKGGLRVSGWLILYGLLAGLLNFGGFWFFMLPSILMSIFFIFGMYEVVVDNKRPVAALKGSLNTVAENFGSILGRILLFFVLNVVVSFLLPSLFNAISESVGAAYSLINMIFSIILGWFGVAYMLTLYRQAKAATPAAANRNGLFWTLVSLSLLGWITFLVMSSFLLSMIPKLMENFPNNQDSFSEMSGMDGSSLVQTNTVPSSCGFTLGLPLTSSDEKPPRFWIYEERPMTADSFRGLVPAAQLKNGTLGAVVSFKTNAERLGDEKTFNLGYTGYNIFCVDNPKDFDLDGFVSDAQKNSGKTVTLNGEKQSWGDLEVQPVYVEGLSDGDFYKEPVYMAVTPVTTSKLVIIIPWGIDPEDDMADQVNEDMATIQNSIKFLEEKMMLEDDEAVMKQLL